MNTTVAYTDGSVSTGTSYAYRVRALGNQGEGQVSASAAVTTRE